MVDISDRYVGHVLSRIYMPGSGQIWMDEVRCTDSCLSVLTQCDHGGWGVHDCNHFDDVIIACYDLDSHE